MQPSRATAARAAIDSLGLLSFTALPVAGQVTNTAAPPDLPRMPDGHPDLQGTYDLATKTPLKRWPGDPPLLTKEQQAETLQEAEAERRAKSAGGDESLPPDRPALPVGGDTSIPKSFFEAVEKRGGGAPGFYNRFWLNQGSTYTVVAGGFEHPSSSIRRMVVCLPTMSPHASGYRRPERRQTVGRQSNFASISDVATIQGTAVRRENSSAVDCTDRRVTYLQTKMSEARKTGAERQVEAQADKLLAL